MCGSMADIQSPTAEIRRGIKKDRRKKLQDENIYGLLYYIGRPEINYETIFLLLDTVTCHILVYSA